MKVFLNDTLVDADDAAIGIQNAGFTHAVGLFETMAALHGRVFRLDAHLERLAASANMLGLARDLRLEPLADAIGQTLAANQLEAARIRLTVTPGEVSLLQQTDAVEPTPTVLVVATPPTAYDDSYFTAGVSVLIAPAAANPMDAMAGHKTLNYWARLRALRQAASVGAGEVIWMNISNHLAGGAISNLFIVKDQTLLTPIARGEEVENALPAPVLPGVTRAAIIEIAEERDIPVQRRMLDINDLLEADEVFLTNSSWQVLPVTKVEQKTIGEGAAGELTTRLRGDLLKRIDRECSE